MFNECFRSAILPHPAIALAMAARLGERPVARNWTQFLVLTLVVWVALLYSGIGNAMGVPPDAMANRIEARMLVQLRQHGTSRAARWTRAETGVEMSTWTSVTSPPVLAHDPFAAVLPLPDIFFEPAEWRAETFVLAGLSVRAAPRWQTPLTRAPPLQTTPILSRCA